MIFTLTTWSALSHEIHICFILPMKCAISNDNCLHVFSTLGENLELPCEETDYFQLVSNVITGLILWSDGKLPDVRATSHALS